MLYSLRAHRKFLKTVFKAAAEQVSLKVGTARVARRFVTRTTAALSPIVRVSCLRDSFWICGF